MRGRCVATRPARRALDRDIAAANLSLGALQAAAAILLSPPSRGGLLHTNSSGAFVVTRSPPPHTHVNRCAEHLRWFRLRSETPLTVPLSMEASASVSGTPPPELPFLAYARRPGERAPLVPRYYVDEAIHQRRPKVDIPSWRHKLNRAVFRGSPTNAVRLALCRAARRCLPSLSRLLLRSSPRP